VGVAALACCAAAISWSAAANAAPPGSSPGGAGKGDKPGRLSIDKDLGSTQAGRTARTRAEKGDCKGALDAFDEALRNSIDATLFRDRGVCHEQLGHPYPAMDDYRTYLTALPDAKDADAVRARLAKLEGDTGVLVAKVDETKEEDKKKNEDKKKDDSAKAAATGSGSVSLGFNEQSASASASSEGAGGDASANDKRPLDDIEADERKSSDADASPLRRGSGFVLGPYFGVRRWFEKQLAWSEVFGGAFRYSLGKTSSLISELGYMSVNATGAASSMGGFVSFLGYEARIGLDPALDNALIVAFGGGYDRFKQGATGQVLSTFEGRGRFGFRHVFGRALGLEVTADGGVAHLTLVDAPSGVDASKTTGFFGGTIALVVGF
jgi:tetratricopeptide (TPR) repeat protein